MKHVIFSRNAPIENVYFPIGAVISEVAVMENGTSIEVATTGREGMVGLPAFLGANSTVFSAFVQVPGEALRMSVADLRAETADGGPLSRILLRFANAHLVQVGQGAACNQLHSVRQRCARWLLMTHDRVGRDEFALTHEFMCQMLGVRRATVTEIAGALQHEGIIRNHRGRFTIVDRSALETVTCECYWVIRQEFQQMMKGWEEVSKA
ncbi:MAG: Crp/Fnr family transcriptional regulator [Janthinobacterium lividum]